MPPLEETLSSLLHRAAFGMAAELNGELCELGFAVPHYLVLLALAREAPRSQKEVGSTTCINRTKMVALIDDLERLGLAERRRNPEDRREHLVHLTEGGRDRLAEAEQRHRAVESRWLEALTPQERPVLLALLARLAARADSLPSGSSPCSDD